jgi:hypothetical protein
VKGVFNNGIKKISAPAYDIYSSSSNSRSSVFLFPFVIMISSISRVLNPEKTLIPLIYQNKDTGQL